MRNEAELLVGGILVTRTALVRALHAVHLHKKRFGPPPTWRAGDSLVDLVRAQQRLVSGWLGLSAAVHERLLGGAEPDPPPLGRRLILSAAAGGPSSFSLSVRAVRPGTIRLQLLEVRDESGPCPELTAALSIPAEITADAPGPRPFELSLQRGPFLARGPGRSYASAVRVERSGEAPELLPLEIEVHP